MHKSDNLFCSFSDSRDKRLCLPHCGSNIWVAAFTFLPWLEASPCPKSRERTLFHTPQVAPRCAKARRGWEDVLDVSFAMTAQKWGLSLRTPQGDLLSQLWISWGLEWLIRELFHNLPCFPSCLRAFYKLKPIIHKIKGPEYPNCSVEESLRLPSTTQRRAKAELPVSINPLKSCLSLQQLWDHPAWESSPDLSSNGPFQDSSSIKAQIGDEEMTLILGVLPCSQHPHSLLPPAPQPPFYSHWRPLRSGCFRPRSSSGHSSIVFNENW